MLESPFHVSRLEDPGHPAPISFVVRSREGASQTCIIHRDRESFTLMLGLEQLCHRLQFLECEVSPVI